jgi:hypothetical protein
MYLLQFFTWEHLREPLQAVSKPFGELAPRIGTAGDEAAIDQLIGQVELTLPENPEKVTALRKLREAHALLRRSSIELSLGPLRLTVAAEVRSSTPDIEGVLRLLLEAKDCAVRAVLFKPAG